jgi:hypothetical protein
MINYNNIGDILGYLYLGRAIPVQGPVLISTMGTLEGLVDATVFSLACLGGAFVLLGHVFPRRDCTDRFSFAEGFWVTKALTVRTLGSSSKWNIGY